MMKSPIFPLPDSQLVTERFSDNKETPIRTIKK